MDEELTIRLHPASTKYDFSVKACSNARIVLKEGGASSDTLYTLIMGDEGNTVTTLQDSNNQQLAQSPTPDILECFESKFFHLSVSIP